MAFPLRSARPIISLLEINTLPTKYCRLLSLTKPIYCLTPSNNNQRDPDKWLYKRIWFTLSMQFSKAMQTLDRKCIEHKNKLSEKTQQLKAELSRQSVPMESESFAKRYKELFQTKRNEFYTKTIQPQQKMLQEKWHYSRCVSRCYFARYGQPILDIWWSIICSVRERILQIQNNERFRRMMVIIRKKSAEMMAKMNQSFAKQNFLKKSQKKIGDGKN